MLFLLDSLQISLKTLYQDWNEVWMCVEKILKHPGHFQFLLFRQRQHTIWRGRVDRAFFDYRANHFRNKGEGNKKSEFALSPPAYSRSSTDTQFI
jgi:hypothetical protein